MAGNVTVVQSSFGAFLDDVKKEIAEGRAPALPQYTVDLQVHVRVRVRVRVPPCAKGRCAPVDTQRHSNRCLRHTVGGGCLPQPRWAVCATGAGAHRGQTSREREKDIWWTAGTARRGTRHLGLTHTETQRGRL